MCQSANQQMDRFRAFLHGIGALISLAFIVYVIATVGPVDRVAATKLCAFASLFLIYYVVFCYRYAAFLEDDYDDFDRRRRR